MKVVPEAIEAMRNSLDPVQLDRIDGAIERIVSVKQYGGRVIVVTGSGPNLHEGVTTLVAELMRIGMVDGVTTSSAVVAHEMGGVLERVKRVAGADVGISDDLLPHGGTFELTALNDETLQSLSGNIDIDWSLIRRLREARGEKIIKAAGNLSYPMGLHMERLADRVLSLALSKGQAFEEAVGLSADERTMIGRGARQNLPVLVTIPQLVGGGAVGLAIGDSISISARSRRLASMLDSADVIIESGVALTQEIHDGPFETYTGHGLWAAWQGQPTFRLEGKTLIRIDLDPALEKVWQLERNDSSVQNAIDQGLPKTKLFDTPFRMEMSGFARLEGSIAITGDIGVVWPILATGVARRLDRQLDFLSYPQNTPLGQQMREWIVENMRPLRMPDDGAETDS